MLKAALDLATDAVTAKGEDVKDYFFPAHWDPNHTADRKSLERYREWIVKGMERVVSQTINCSVLYTIRPREPRETPLSFLVS